MKNLFNKIILTGMIGAGSLGIFGKGYGQETVNNKYVMIILNVMDNNYDKKADEYSLYYLAPEINILTYKDTNFDGKMDVYSLNYYLGHTSKIIEWIKENEIKKDNVENKNGHETLIAKFGNYSIGTHSFCEEKICDKKNILDCLIELF